MTIFLIVLINLLMGTLFYVIISLKLEKSAVEFRSKKLRREVDEIIREFNETAERNITLLEHKIATLNRLMKVNDNNDDIKEVNVLLKDANEDFSHIDNEEPLNKGVLTKKDDEIEQSSKKSLKQLFTYIISEIGRFARKKLELYAGGVQSNRVSLENLPRNLNENLNSLNKENHPIAKNFEEFAEIEDLLSESNDKLVNEMIENENQIKEEIKKRFDKSDDKFLLVNQLISDGFSIEDISKYSGMPKGEVKLVSNLSR